MKIILQRALAAIVLIISLLMISYPFLSNYLMSLNQSSAVADYEKKVESASDKEIDAQRKAAKEYNKSLIGSVINTKDFDPGIKETNNPQYDKLLNISGNSIMASIEIPAINVNMPIYHGTSNEVLSKGAGHLSKTSLPVGGKGTHAVITGHTGLSSARLFTDLNQLKKDDVFYIHCLGDILVYKIDNIKIIEPDNTADLKIDKEHDYVTLITCTPYGINTKRLLVRGTRIPYNEANKLVANKKTSTASTWTNEYIKALFIGAAICLLIIVSFVIVCKIISNHKKKKQLANGRNKE